jgi:hypothetical protein
MGRDYDYEEPAPTKLGKCCCCGVENESVRNIMMMDRRIPDPVPEYGCWGCFQCGLPMAGAVAVLCDYCIADGRCHPEFVCVGAPADNRRIPVAGLAEFHHDMTLHPGES